MEDKLAINDFIRCIEQAHELGSSIKNNQRREARLYRAFSSLAQDGLCGAIAFGIWRERCRLLSSKT